MADHLLWHIVQLCTGDPTSPHASLTCLYWLNHQLSHLHTCQQCNFHVMPNGPSSETCMLCRSDPSINASTTWSTPLLGSCRSDSPVTTNVASQMQVLKMSGCQSADLLFWSHISTIGPTWMELPSTYLWSQYLPESTIRSSLTLLFEELKISP